MADYIGAIDQGTTSTRFIVFDRAGQIVASAQEEHEQIYPQPGWVEHDAEEIWRRTESVIAKAMQAGKFVAKDLTAIGITNQRETTVVWNKKTGKPVYARRSRRRGVFKARRPGSISCQNRATAGHIFQRLENSLDP
jgi:glycerol kinase